MRIAIIAEIGVVRVRMGIEMKETYGAILCSRT